MESKRVHAADSTLDARPVFVAAPLFKRLARVCNRAICGGAHSGARVWRLAAQWACVLHLVLPALLRESPCDLLGVRGVVCVWRLAV